MKKNQRLEVRQKSGEELKKALQEARLEMGKMKIDQAMGKLHNTGGMKELKKNIARMMTALGDLHSKNMTVSTEEAPKQEVKVEKKKKEEKDAK